MGIGDLAEVKVIKAKKNYGYARLMRLIEPSPHRVEPICPVARPCGGCQLQMLDYAEQLRFKEKKIAQNLQRIGGMTEIPMEPIVGMEMLLGLSVERSFFLLIGRAYGRSGNVFRRSWAFCLLPGRVTG